MKISTYILLDSYDCGAGIVLDASEEYFANAEKNPPTSETYADTHTTDLARYYNLVYWVYGGDKEEYADLPEQTGLPEGRADGCEAEYKKFEKSLDVLFADFRK